MFNAEYINTASAVQDSYLKGWKVSVETFEQGRIRRLGTRQKSSSKKHHKAAQ